MFSGFLKYKPSGGRKPMIGKQIITPGSANMPINFGFHDGTGYSSAVVVPVANVLAGTTIAGQVGTMSNRSTASYAALSSAVVETTLYLRPPAGYYDGGTGYAVTINDPNFIAANILSGKSIYGVAGTFSNIKSIQRGTTTVNAATVNVAIGAVDLTKSIVILTIKPVVGNTPGQSLAKGELTTSTNLALTISDVTYPPEVDWTAVEFNNVKSKQTGTKTTSLATDTVTVSSVDISKSILFFSCSSTDVSSTAGAYFFMSLVLTNSTTITTKQPSALNKTISWQLIEFN